MQRRTFLKALLGAATAAAAPLAILEALDAAPRQLGPGPWVYRDLPSDNLPSDTVFQLKFDHRAKASLGKGLHVRVNLLGRYNGPVQVS